MAYKMWVFSTLVAGILHKKKNLKDLIELRFEDLTSYPLQGESFKVNPSP
jgi:hypothetical protein